MFLTAALRGDANSVFGENVDFGAGVRAALAGVQDRERLGLAVGAESVEIETDAGITGIGDFDGGST